MSESARIKTPLSCPRFIGRVAEMAALLERARNLEAGGGAVVFVSGDAGIGKTRFLAEFRKQLPKRVVCAAAAFPEFAPAPLAPISAILAGLAGRAAGTPGSEMLETAIEGAPGKLRLFARVSKALRDASALGPVVVMIDDFHWADTATLDLITYLASDLADEPVLLVLGYRSDAVTKTHPLEIAISRLNRIARVELLELSPLGAAEIGEMIDATLLDRRPLEADALRYVRTKSEGNPLFAEELLKAALERGGPRSSAPPASLRGLILERIAKLGPEHVRLLEVAALIGRRINAGFLERVSDGQTQAAILAFLRLAVAEHFLVEDRAEPGWFAFRHALVRETILVPLLLVELRAMHLRIAREIENEPDARTRSLELSDHYWQAAEFERCAPAAVEAADRARASHAYQEAADQYERALACGAHGEADRAEFHERAAQARIALGNTRAGVDHLESAAALFAGFGATESVISVYLDLALARRRCGDTPGAFAALERASRLESDAPSKRWRVRILIQLAQLQTLVGDWTNGARTLEAAEILLELAAPRDLVRFYTSRADVRFARLARDESQADFDRAILAARASQDPTLVAFTLTSSGMKSLKVGRLDLALPAFREVVRMGALFGPLYSVSFARLGYAQALYLAGKLDEARAQVLELIAEGHDSLTIRVLVAQLGATLSLVLREDALYRRSDVAIVLEKALAANEPRLSAQLAAVVAEKRLLDGDRDAAIDLLRRMLASLPDDELVCEVLLPVAICCDREEVEFARRIIDRTRLAANPYAEACAELFAGYAAVRFDGPGVAERHAVEAAKRFRALEMPLLEAEAYVLARQGPRATALCERARARQLTRRLPSARSEHTAQIVRLTQREREISDLAIAGLSNKAIAIELSLSERTVESHLAASYAKLGVRSRAELVMARR